MTQTALDPAEPRLAHFPVTFFATVMGLAGLTLALHLAETRFGWGHGASTLALWVTIADFVGVALLFALKALRHPGAIAGEWNHPVKLAFFPAISISLMLIATALRADFGQAALVVWSVGAALQAVLFLSVISGWIGRRPFQPMHISPAWFIPAVGNVVAPVAGVSLGFVELSWLFFATGLVFWIVLLTLVMNRLIFHDPLPGRLYPTLVILIAPPAVGFLAWLQLNGGQLDAFARILYYAGITFAGIVAMQGPAIARLPFALSWWALSFPIAALTIATLRYGALAGSGAHDLLGGALLALLLAVVLGLIARTALAATRGEICRPE
ncbi:SLAC1 anion channel family protein [Tropicibacter oceani]|uniref:SLAC1 anion channel family protein n=1 Tax=Tropicibacter oceani TaxID=3058420 RepID=A0ABY8QNT5_9RHOB|nr:SLAC1 anion channel family protein [Tropicibacter oceani]WGW05686.1 SLAC1 anion channel family protein [Tropicibacter oceani]